MTKPTGRPKGAPRKYAAADERPITLSLRVPRELVQPLKRYAAQHRQSMSELLLDGLRWRLSEGDPRGNGVALPPAGAEPDKPYYENTDEGNMLVREVRELRTLLTQAVASGALAAQAKQQQGSRSDLFQNSEKSVEPQYSRNTEIHESGTVAVESSAPVPSGYGALTATVRAALAQQRQPVTCQALVDLLGVRYGVVHQVLDKLTKRGHVMKQGTHKRAVYALARPA
jgi:hypothetical protein